MSPLVLMQRAEPGGGEGGHCPLAQRKKKNQNLRIILLFFMFYQYFFIIFLIYLFTCQTSQKKKKERTTFLFYQCFLKFKSYKEKQGYEKQEHKSVNILFEGKKKKKKKKLVTFQMF